MHDELFLIQNPVLFMGTNLHQNDVKVTPLVLPPVKFSSSYDHAFQDAAIQQSFSSRLNFQTINSPSQHHVFQSIITARRIIFVSFTLSFICNLIHANGVCVGTFHQAVTQNNMHACMCVVLMTMYVFRPDQFSFQF